ncbi:MAG: outer membrane protein assembly factor BamB family protein [Pirellulaceae bacterium]
MHAATLNAGPEETDAESLPVSLWTRPEGEDWPSFLGPNRDGKSSETGILTDWPPAGPRIVWQRTIGKSFAAGSISRGRLFHFDRAGDRARLFCVNAETGTELWMFEYPTDFVDADDYDNGPRGSPVVDDHRVYIYGAEGMLYCLRADDGAIVWTCDTIRQFGVFKNVFGVGSTPVVEQAAAVRPRGGSRPSRSERTRAGCGGRSRSRHKRVEIAG